VSVTVRPIRVSATVPAPADEVFMFVADTRNDPTWCPNVTAVEQLAGDGVQVGSRFRFHQTVEMRGRRLESDVEVEILSIGERTIEWSVDDRFQTRHVVLTVTPTEGGSRVTQQTTATFKRNPGIAKWLYPFLARRTFRGQFAELARRFERATN